MIGRFSAESAADVDTQVQRTIEYETNQSPLQDWFRRGAGVGADPQPLDAIRQQLLSHGYTHVDQLYDPDATAQDIAAALNAGRGILNYIGHGSATSWSTGPFATTDVAALVNDNMLPFIFSTATSNGAFDSHTCLAEAWLRARHGSEPTGAIAAFMASGNLYVFESMMAHQEFIDLYLEETYNCFGTLCFAATSKLIDEFGSSGVMIFDMWNVFGDPSLRIVGAYPGPGDFDANGVVDLDDYDELSGCLSGPWNFSESTVAQPCLLAFDFDDDQDVDLDDFTEFAVLLAAD